jgi:hypothetical protein
MGWTQMFDKGRRNSISHEGSVQIAIIIIIIIIMLTVKWQGLVPRLVSRLPVMGFFALVYEAILDVSKKK